MVHENTKIVEEDMKEYLDKNAYYMNPPTGSIAKGSEWMQDFREAKKENRKLTWHQWASIPLIEVTEEGEEI